jgi:hypothetical protein
VTAQEVKKTTKPNPESGKQQGRRVALLQEVLLPVLAVFTGLVVGGIIIAISNDASITAWSNFFQSPGAALKATWDAISIAYGALFKGALGNPKDMLDAFAAYQATGDNALYIRSQRALLQPLLIFWRVWLLRWDSGAACSTSVRKASY